MIQEREHAFGYMLTIPQLSIPCLNSDWSEAAY